MLIIEANPEMERLVMMEAYNLHGAHHDPVITVVSMVMIPVLIGCLVTAFIILRKPATKRTL